MTEPNGDVSPQRSGLSPYMVDALERLGWSLAEVTVAWGIVVSTDLEGWYVVPLVTLLTAAKATVARHVGDPRDAAVGKRLLSGGSRE